MTDFDRSDVLELGRRLRRLVSAYQDVDFIIEGSFAAVDPALEQHVAPLRPLTRNALNAAYELLRALERTPTFKAARSRAEEPK